MPERTVMGKGRHGQAHLPRTLKHPPVSSRSLDPPRTPPFSPPGRSPVAAATLPAQEKRRGRRMSGDGTRDGGDAPRGPTAWRAGACSSTEHFSIWVQTRQFRTFCIFLVLYIIVTDFNFVHFVKKIGVWGGFISSPLVLGSPAQRWALGMQAGLPGRCHRRSPCQHLPVQHLIFGLISTSGSAGTPRLAARPGMSQVGTRRDLSPGDGVPGASARRGSGTRRWWGGEDAPGCARNRDGLSIELPLRCWLSSRGCETIS